MLNIVVTFISFNYGIGAAMFMGAHQLSLHAMGSGGRVPDTVARDNDATSFTYIYIPILISGTAERYEKEKIIKKKNISYNGFLFTQSI